MIQNNQEIKESNNINHIDIKDIPSKLVIKNIPNSLSDNKIKDILKKNFEEHIKDDILIVKLEKKYSMKKRNKICFMTVDNLKTRNEVFDFFSTFELVDPKGIKQKLIVNDCLYQSKPKSEIDPIENSINDNEHFLKFKEYFEKEKIIEFKKDENKYCDNLFDGIINNESNLGVKTVSNNSPTKMIILKKKDVSNFTLSNNEENNNNNNNDNNNNNNNSNNNNKNNNNNNNNVIEVIEDNRNNNNNYYNNKNSKYRNNNNYYDNKGKGKYKDNYNHNYYNNRKNSYYDNDNYGNNNNYGDNNYYNKNYYNKGYRKGGY